MDGEKKMVILQGCEEICGLCSKLSKLSDELREKLEEGESAGDIIRLLQEKMEVAGRIKERASQLSSMKKGGWEKGNASLNALVGRARREVEEALESEEESWLLLSKRGLKVTGGGPFSLKSQASGG